MLERLLSLKTFLTETPRMIVLPAWECKKAHRFFVRQAMRFFGCKTEHA